MDRRSLTRAARLSEQGRPYVLATVVWHEGPTSGRTGSTALIHPDGRMEGWLGGACAQPTVTREALAALRDGRPRRLALGVAAGAVGPEVVVEPMACASEGALEVYMEPMLPAPLLVVVGDTPMVDVLVTAAGALDWRTAVVDDGGQPADHPGAGTVVTDLRDLAGLPVDERSFVVVATQGHYDEPAVRAALATPADYVGLVASAKRADEVVEWLRSRGVDEAALARLRAPAGLDLGSVEHEEIAVAILAELVGRRARSGTATAVETATVEEATDPVCGMTVALEGAHHTTEHAGATHHFCSAGCQRAFERDPGAYLDPA